MAKHGVFLASMMAAQNIDAYNRNAIADVDLDNGWAVKLGALSKDADKSKVFTAELADEASTGVYIVDNPVHPLANGYSVGQKDPREAYVPKGTIFAARKAVKGDVMKISADQISDTANKFIAINKNGGYKYIATEPSEGFVAKIIENSYFSIGMMTDTLTQRVDAVLVEVIAN